MTLADTRTRVSRRRAFASSLGSGILLALVPKCPLCVAVALSSLGLGATCAGVVAPLVKPFAIALAVLALVALAYGELRRHRWARVERHRGHCCSR